MNKIFKRVFAVVLAFAMIFSCVPMSEINGNYFGITAYAAGEGVQKKLDSLRTKFPNGYFWNHKVTAYSNNGDQLVANWDESFSESVTGSHCATHNGVASVGQYDCNFFDGGIQCFGFAGKIFYDVFGQRKSNLQKVYNNNYGVSVGDYVRINNDTHSAVVLSRSGDYITVVECNLSGDGNIAGNCKIRWDASYSISSITYYIHATNYSEVDSANIHSCSYTSSITSAATCNATGVRTYKCSCGKSYTEVIAKNPSNHTGGTTIKNAVAATPFASGYTGDTYCKGCNVLLQYGETIPKIDESQWVYVNTIPSHVTTDKYEIEYNNTYAKVATTAPDSSWVKGSKVRTEYVNNGNKYESDFQLSTSNTRVLDSYYYYHWCGDSTGNYINYAYTGSYNHYDAYYETNAVVEEQSVADGDDSRYIAYKLAWSHKPSEHCYCLPGLTCDSSNSHSTRSCWWYKRYVYQDKKEVVYYNFTKESGWVDELDTNATSVEYRYKLKDCYTITYDANGGENVPESQIKNYGVDITLSSLTPTRDGYNFLGWSTDESANEPEFLAGSVYSENEDIILYAVWEEKEVEKGGIWGSIQTSGNDSDIIIFEFTDVDNVDDTYTSGFDGDVSDYGLYSLAPGKYILKVSKENHVTREYEVAIGEEDVNLDVQLNLVGDINGDGKVTLLDYTQVLRHVKKTSELAGYEYSCADVNGDGRLMVTDYAKILKHVKKTETLW